jgi:hypothetical protein
MAGFRLTEGLPETPRRILYTDPPKGEYSPLGFHVFTLSSRGDLGPFDRVLGGLGAARRARYLQGNLTTTVRFPRQHRCPRGKVLNLGGLRSYKIDYSAKAQVASAAHIRLILLVGAGRFERPTPCAPGTFGILRKALVFWALGFNGLRIALLKPVGLYGLFVRRRLQNYLRCPWGADF